MKKESENERKDRRTGREGGREAGRETKKNESQRRNDGGQLRNVKRRERLIKAGRVSRKKGLLGENMDDGKIG